MVRRSRDAKKRERDQGKKDEKDIKECGVHVPI